MKVTFICPIYNTFPEIVGSCINQTYRNWELLLIHDGPNSTNLRQLIDVIGDERIKYIETEQRGGLWGHPIRKMALENIDALSPDADYIVITNDDNHHVPLYLEYLLSGFTNPSIIATYCSHFVQGYKSPQQITIFKYGQPSCNNLKWMDYRYGVCQTQLALGYIDVGCVMVKKSIAVESGWSNMEHSSDWDYFKRIIDKYGEKVWNRIFGTLLVHN